MLNRYSTAGNTKINFTNKELSIKLLFPNHVPPSGDRGLF